MARYCYLPRERFLFVAAFRSGYCTPVKSNPRRMNTYTKLGWGVAPYVGGVSQIGARDFRRSSRTPSCHVRLQDYTAAFASFGCSRAVLMLLFSACPERRGANRRACPEAIFLAGGAPPRRLCSQGLALRTLYGSEWLTGSRGAAHGVRPSPGPTDMRCSS